MDNPIFCAETNRQETKHESVNNITLFILAIDYDIREQ